MPTSRWRVALVLTGWLLLGGGATAQDDLDLSELSIEELLGIQVEVTSVARKPQKLMDTAAAVYILTSEEIRRSGVDTLPEALRLVPGLHVGRAEAALWDISARGFNTGGSNKMLVMIDGRTVYTIFDGGVFWEQQDLPLEDIDRIEVIRGPGSSVWGANAFNGVISIITKDASQTKGTLVSTEVGNESRFLTARYGSDLGEHGSWRVWARAYDRDEMDFAGSNANDDWYMNRGGFRADWDMPSGDHFTFQGDIYDGRVNGVSSVFTLQTSAGVKLTETSTRIGGANLLGRWWHQVSDTNDFQVQAFLDHSERNGRSLNTELDTADIEFSQNVQLGDSNDIVWGGGYRYNVNDADNSPSFQLDPERRTFNIFNLFVQDEITAIEDTLYFTLGSKFENNSFTGWEVQPTARVTYTPNERHTIWGAVSRGVRVPTLIEEDAFIPVQGFPDDGTQGFDGILAFGPADDLESERVYAFELGYRGDITDDLFVDIATYYNLYDNLESEELQPDQQIDANTVLFEFEPKNKIHGSGRGVEVYVEYQATENWTLASAYTWLRMSLRKDSSSNDTFGADLDKLAPKNILNLQSYYTFNEQWEFDAFLYYVDELRFFDVDSYWRGDIRVGYHPNDQDEISVGVRNLFHDGEQESELGEVSTEYYVRGVFRF